MQIHNLVNPRCFAAPKSIKLSCYKVDIPAPPQLARLFGMLDTPMAKPYWHRVTVAVPLKGFFDVRKGRKYEFLVKFRLWQGL